MVSVRSYQQELEDDVNELRKSQGKKEFEYNHSEKTRINKVSKNDPERGVFYKGEREKCFAYSANTACDIQVYVTGMTLSPGNEHDSQSFYDLYNQLERYKDNMQNVVLDAGYLTPHICKHY